eukprot:2687407-Prymnesium_polylepis.1
MPRLRFDVTLGGAPGMKGVLRSWGRSQVMGTRHRRSSPAFCAATWSARAGSSAPWRAAAAPGGAGCTRSWGSLMPMPAAMGGAKGSWHEQQASACSKVPSTPDAREGFARAHPARLRGENGSQELHQLVERDLQLERVALVGGDLGERLQQALLDELLPRLVGVPAPGGQPVKGALEGVLEAAAAALDERLDPSEPLDHSVHAGLLYQQERHTRDAVLPHEQRVAVLRVLIRHGFEFCVDAAGARQLISQGVHLRRVVCRLRVHDRVQPLGLQGHRLHCESAQRFCERIGMLGALEKD